MDKTKHLTKLLSDLSYYNAAEGEMYFREGPQRREAEKALKLFLSVHTREEIEDLWPKKEDGTKQDYLVFASDIWPFCKGAQ